MLGGGQLGRMSLLAGRRMGYRFHVYEPAKGCCAAPVADATTFAAYESAFDLEVFGKSVSLATLEFENIPHASLVALDVIVPVHPKADVLYVCQNRRREKLFLREHGFPCADFRVVEDATGLQNAVNELGTPCVLKTADFGYDGKGQYKIESTDQDWSELWRRLGIDRAVAEAWVPFAMECSVIVARNGRGGSRCFPVAENLHRNHILHQSIVPARISKATERAATELAHHIAEAIDCVGLLTVELFILDNGEVLVNELAPRPHNSGHWSLDACATSQFEQHIRAVCGQPLGATHALRPAVMVNLLGDVWKGGVSPNWSSLLADPDIHLHLYDKGDPRPGRKMGHYTVVKDSVEAALSVANERFALLSHE